MSADILFSMGIEGSEQTLSQINRIINSVNTAFSNIQMPNLDFSRPSAIFSATVNTGMSMKC